MPSISGLFEQVSGPTEGQQEGTSVQYSGAKRRTPAQHLEPILGPSDGRNVGVLSDYG